MTEQDNKSPVQEAPPMKLDVSVRHMYLFRLVLVHLPEQFRDSSLTAIRKIHRKLLLLKLRLLHVFTKEHVLRTELSAS